MGNLLGNERKVPELIKQKMSRFLIMSLLPLFFLLFMVAVVSGQDEPISTEEYQSQIGAGFSTNWFKSRARKPMEKFSEKNIKDVREKGFSNLRIRCDAELYSSKGFLVSLTTVVDSCLKYNLIPIISWIHHRAEAYATKKAQDAYVSWWIAVARQLKDKDYRLSFNLFTELGIDTCSEGENEKVKIEKSCKNSLRRNTDKYNEWTKNVTKEIRALGGKNAKRILILASPVKTAKGLDKIDPEIYERDPYMMAEWHLYASGPIKTPGSQKYWSGDGTGKFGGRENVKKAINDAVEFTNKTGMRTYLGAWMPHDNIKGSLKEAEVIKFALFFVKELRKGNIPWSMNVLDNYYDTRECKWRRGHQVVAGQKLNMAKILNNIRKVMP